MNRVQASITRMRKQIDGRIRDGLTTAAKVEDARRALDIDPADYARFQELKSLAFVNGLLTDEEAQFVYRLLGVVPATFNDQDVAIKSVLTQLFKELMERFTAHVQA